MSLNRHVDATPVWPESPVLHDFTGPHFLSKFQMLFTFNLSYKLEVSITEILKRH